MANIQGCFNCEFFKARGQHPKSHVPGTKYHGVCGNSARPNNSGEMSILMTEERPNASEGCEYHSGNLTQRAADWRDAPVKSDGSALEDYGVKWVGSRARR